MPTQLIEFELDGPLAGCRVVITKADDDNCPKGGVHDFSSAILTYLTRRKDRRYINQEKYLIPGTTLPRKEHRRMHIVAGETACSKCGCPYTHAHNPYFL
jgi:hypothetical protein